MIKKQKNQSQFYKLDPVSNVLNVLTPVQKLSITAVRIVPVQADKLFFVELNTFAQVLRDWDPHRNNHMV